ncbi:MAG: leucine--tRNA ligase [Actinomycetota bacterium]
MSEQTSTTTRAGEPDQPAHRYTANLAADIEQRWQDVWQGEGTFRAPNPDGPWADPEQVAGRDKLYILDMFPYPSGAGLHVGHPLGYIATDVYGRFQRMRGRNVLHALGYDAFGLPAEQYAIQTGAHPRATTEANIANMRRQLRRLGLAHDDRRSPATTDVEFYRWTQWVFLQVYDAWFDADADGGRGRARHVDELRAELASGARPVPGGGKWDELSPAEQRRVVDDHRLAYLSDALVNWCPGLGTVLANEEVTAEGRSDIGNFPVFKRNLRQWKMRITAYGDRLLADLDGLDWPDPVKHMQRNWIGRSEGATVRFATDHGDISVFTTRPDTLFGATFVVLAPEHPLVDSLVPGAWPEGTLPAWTAGAGDPTSAVGAYRETAAAKTDLERQAEGREKTGVFTGGFATNPVTGQPVPVFVADYVLMGYGTGAIMAVPAQDERDWAFATSYDLPIVRTVQPPADWAGEAFTGDGPAINSANDEVSLDGLGVADAKRRIVEWLQGKGLGESTVTYRLRDWLFSRQRYWGEPFPIVFDEDDQPRALPESMLPVLLPDVENYRPQTLDPDDAVSEPMPPLSGAGDWTTVELDLGDGVRTYRRELNVMPQWAGSCWYELRYLDPENASAFVDPQNEAYWMGPRSASDPGGVDLYVGGVEHAVLHLLYSRFWHKVLFDLGHVTSSEPFRRLFNQGYIQAYAYRDGRGQPVPAAEVVEAGDGTWSFEGAPVTREYGKMGKSLKNVVTPDEMYDAYGADTFRVYEMSMGPLDVSRPWETRAVVGSLRFLQRLWRNVVYESTGELRVTEDAADLASRQSLHRAIEGISRDYEALRFNTAVAKLIELNNVATKLDVVPRELAEPLVLMTAPLAPHLAEEMWRLLGHDGSLAFEPFPAADPALLVLDTVTCVVQVQGKVRDRLEVPPGIGEDELRELALASEKVAGALAGREIRTVVVRAPKLVNIVPV